TNVSNARMNIPKAIKSLKSNGFLSISTTPILCRNRGQPPCNTVAPCNEYNICFLTGQRKSYCHFPEFILLYLQQIISKRSYQFMKFIYPAVFRKKEAGGYHAFFPDLECCEADGETLDDAIEKANEACRTWIEVELEEDEPVMPYVSDIEDIKVQ